MEFALNHLREIDDSYLENQPVGFFFADQKSNITGIDRSPSWQV